MNLPLAMKSIELNNYQTTIEQLLSNLLNVDNSRIVVIGKTHHTAKPTGLRRADWAALERGAVLVQYAFGGISFQKVAGAIRESSWRDSQK